MIGRRSRGLQRCRWQRLERQRCPSGHRRCRWWWRRWRRRRGKYHGTGGAVGLEGAGANGVQPGGNGSQANSWVPVEGGGATNYDNPHPLAQVGYNGGVRIIWGAGLRTRTTRAISRPWPREAARDWRCSLACAFTAPGQGLSWGSAEALPVAHAEAAQVPDAGPLRHLAHRHQLIVGHQHYACSLESTRAHEVER